VSLYNLVFFPTVPISVKPAVRLKLRSIEKPDMPLLLSFHVKLIWLLEMDVAWSEVGADNAASEVELNIKIRDKTMKKIYLVFI
jgi:hypothetical protein